MPPCGIEAPPDSFDPEVQWAWDGDGEFIYSIVTPLVANLTDDNGDGSVDLCDTPDIVVSVFRQEGCCAPTEAYLYALDGATGTLHWKSDAPVGPTGMTPAIADLDDDGTVEVIALAPDGKLVAFDTTGSTEWIAPEYNGPSSGSIAVAYLDAAGAPEIIVDTYVSDAQGNRLVVGPGPFDPGTELAFEQQDPRSAVLHDHRNLALAQSEVQRHGHRAKLLGGEVRRGQRFDVAAVESDPVAVADPEASQGLGELIHPAVPLGVSERPSVLVDQRGAVGPASRRLRQDLSNQHARPPNSL